MVKEIVYIGENKLRHDTGKVQAPRVRKIKNNIFVLQYFGASNATLLVGKNSCILIDAFESDWYAEQAKAEITKITEKPIKTLIYTHQHADHMGGAAVFADTLEQIIAHTSKANVLGKQELFADNTKQRIVHQFGTNLSLEESISMGLNPALEARGICKPLQPTQRISSEDELLLIDGWQLQLLFAPGETDDQQYVYLPEDGVICCGDNYYASWPNLSALRGGSYRDVNQWILSLEKLLSCKAICLIPGHGELLEGKENIKTVIQSYHDAIAWVLEQTLQGINAGLGPDELVEKIQLPEQWRNLLYLQEYYGTVAWSVRGIYAGYIGWFDGNPTHISSLPVVQKAKRYLQLFGGAERVCTEIQLALDKKELQEAQWGMELCDILINAGVCLDMARKWKAEACVFLGRMQTSANGRHYYLSNAKALRSDITIL